MSKCRATLSLSLSPTPSLSQGKCQNVELLSKPLSHPLPFPGKMSKCRAILSLSLSPTPSLSQGKCQNVELLSKPLSHPLPFPGEMSKCRAKQERAAVNQLSFSKADPGWGGGGGGHRQ